MPDNEGVQLEVKNQEAIQPDDIELFFDPPERLRMTIKKERSYITVKPVWASPLSSLNQYLCLLDAKGDEIVMVKSPESLSPDSFEAVKTELKRRYLAPTITKVREVKVEFWATYWHVDTDRGPKDFVTQSLQENAQWLSETQLVLVDVDLNRFEIPDVTKLDDESRKLIARTL